MHAEHMRVFYFTNGIKYIGKYIVFRVSVWNPQGLNYIKLFSAYLVM